MQELEPKKLVARTAANHRNERAWALAHKAYVLVREQRLLVGRGRLGRRVDRDGGQRLPT